MEFYKVTSNGNSHGVTLPKDVLADLGVVDDDGSLDGQTHARVEYVGDGRFTVDLVGITDEETDPGASEGAALTESDMQQLAAHAEELEG